MAATLWVGSHHLPYLVAVLLAVVVRLLVTGALHEDGLADFLDGFGGGGHDRERILTIMKDSHIGTYGVLGLIIGTDTLCRSPDLCSLFSSAHAGSTHHPCCRPVCQDGDSPAYFDDALCP